jgi:hypothetical protein
MAQKSQLLATVFLPSLAQRGRLPKLQPNEAVSIPDDEIAIPTAPLGGVVRARPKLPKSLKLCRIVGLSCRHIAGELKKSWEVSLCG